MADYHYGQHGVVPQPRSTPASYDGIQTMPENGLHPVEQTMERLPSAVEASASPYVLPEAHGQAQLGTPPAHPPHQQHLSTTEFQKPEPNDTYMAYHSSSQLPSASFSQASPVPEKTILGLRKPTFFLTLSNIFLVIVVILVGVLPSQLNKNQNTGGACAGGSGASNGGGPPTSPNGTAPTYPATGGNSPRICFDTNTAPRAESQFGAPAVDCPRRDNATARYTVPGTSLTFERVCGVDTTAGDIGSFPTTSMPDCLALCAQLNLYPSSTMGRCLGVSWVFGSGLQGQGSSYCYPKYNISIPRSRRLDTESAYLVT
ncbi:hypothetical protein GGTG_12723 [Gaeumannomyces tritici R3-111a-1]|uniref:Apple domain-containing protein n=1 Tax=Gaeumannomyces tritici (strain R3-111a-1) TaxID=644352 RepID=J3PGU3_GAET3|nr:hypothetical protein GGTG_12723 [Gaeumannomyces tritici R3-111a-1]EJT69840.1 hypothetical protein GGTG_12723 [Gaeumannomyces tritici R3-111a-1]